MYLGGELCGDGHKGEREREREREREILRRAQVVVNACRAVEGVMADRRISKRRDTTKAHRHACTERKH